MYSSLIHNSICNLINFDENFHQWFRRPGSNPRSCHTLKMVLYTSLLNTQQYKVRIKGSGAIQGKE